MKYKLNFWNIQAVENNSKSKTHGEGWTPLLCLVSFATTIGTTIPIGYIIGVTNTPAEYIKAWCLTSFFERYDATLSSSQLEVLWASIVSVFLIGGIFGSFLGAWCCDKFGRKGCLIISAFLLMLSGVLFYFCREANSVEMLILGRFIAGIASALVYTAHPMYLMEISPAKLRGTTGVFSAVGVTVGILVGQIFSLHQVFGTEALWHVALSFYTLITVLCFAPCYWFPESPRWYYVVKQDIKMARIELERLRGSAASESIAVELSDIEAETKSNNDKMSLLAVLKNSELLLPLVLVCTLETCQQLSGINAIFYYSVPIFTKAGFSLENAAWMNLGAGFLNALFSSFGPLLMARFNRRPLMMLSCIGCGLTLLGMAFALNFIDLATWLPMACIVFIAAFIFIFQLGLGPIPYFIGSELFEVAPRPVAMSMGSLFSWTGNFLIGMFFPMLQNAWGSFAFVPCAVSCFCCCLLTWRYLPESRGRDPIDLQPLMKNGFKSKVKV